MAIKFTQLRCPNCGASLMIEADRSEAFCSYCGTRILVTDENKHEYVHRAIDEARIVEAKLKLEQEKADTRTGFILLACLAVFVVVWILLMALLL